MEIALTIQETTKKELIEALSWQMEMGCDEALLDDPSLADDWQVSLDQVIASNAAAPDPIISPLSSAQPQPSQAQLSEPQTQASTIASPLSDKTSDSISHITSLSELKQSLSDFEGCDLKRTATNLVFSDGDPAARIMIIGEAPGKDEDRMGVPFVGKAGQLLDQMLASVKLDRQSVYIANIMPWRPPGNRPPTAEEIEMMRPFVEKHISLKAPDIILALGGTACKALLQSDLGIMKLRGKFQQYQTITNVASLSLPMMPCLHPGFLLRSPQHKGLVFQDLVALRRKADEIGQ